MGLNGCDFLGNPESIPLRYAIQDREDAIGFFEKVLGFPLESRFVEGSEDLLGFDE